MKIEKGKFLGGGHEKEVYENPHNPHLAMGVFHEYIKEPPNFIKGRFYLTKILHLLFFKNIPDMHLAASKPHVIVVDKVGGGNNLKTELYHLDKKRRDSWDLIGELDEFGVSADAAGYNFEYDKDGNICYVDSFEPWHRGIYDKDKFVLNYDPEKLKKALEKLPADKKEPGLSYLKRLEALRKEELKEFVVIKSE